MNRRSTLLAVSPQDDSIPGVHSDLAAFYSFLRSNAGGAWDDTEIIRKENPTRDQILSAINAAKDAAYSLVFFAGHGERVKMNLPWTEMRMLLRSGETITERELNSGSPRCTLILDCGYRTKMEDKEMLLIKTSSFSERGTDSSEVRNIYQRGLAAAESGLVKVCITAVCSTGRATHSFTQHLLNESNQWASSSKGILDLPNAVTLAQEALRREDPQQRAEYHGGRRLHHFPFAVHI